MPDDPHFMARALELAREARARDEVPVGAVLVQNGVILAEGKNEVETRQDATAHAEMLAIAGAQAQLKTWRLTGTTLYVTKEPCPMCAGALAHVRVDRIVFGVGDPKAGACGGCVQSLRSAGAESSLRDRSRRGGRGGAAVVAGIFSGEEGLIFAPDF